MSVISSASNVVVGDGDGDVNPLRSTLNQRVPIIMIQFVCCPKGELNSEQVYAK